MVWNAMGVQLTRLVNAVGKTSRCLIALLRVLRALRGLYHSSNGAGVEIRVHSSLRRAQAAALHLPYPQ
jgi:hypothetical protein